MIPAALVVAAVLALGRGRPNVADYAPASSPQPLPPVGELTSASLAEFEGIVVGQRGRPVIVNVWASWCAPCRTEMPLLNEAAAAYAGRVTVLGVASKDDPDAAQAFLEDLGIDYPNVIDVSGEIRTTLGLTAFPTTYVFSREGRLVNTVRGGVTEQRLSVVIEEALR